MAARAFHKISTHLLLGRIVLGTDPIMADIITTSTDVAALNGSGTKSLQESLWLSQWTSSLAALPFDTDAGSSESAGATVVFANNDVMEFVDPGDVLVYGVLFYYDTGVAGTSPVLAIELFEAPVTVADGVTFIYESTGDGLFQLAVTPASI